MQHLFKKNEIKQDVENRGLNFKEWSESIIQKKRLEVIDKEKPYFDQWELDVLNKAYIDLLRQSVKKEKQKLQSKNKKESNETKVKPQTSQDEKGGGINWN